MSGTRHIAGYRRDADAFGWYIGRLIYRKSWNTHVKWGRTLLWRGRGDPGNLKDTWRRTVQCGRMGFMVKRKPCGSVWVDLWRRPR